MGSDPNVVLNPDRNTELKSRSYVLDGYMKFVEKVRELLNAEDIDNETVVEKAVDYCIENDILSDKMGSDPMRPERRPEVIKVMTLDMTFEAREKIIRKEEYEEGWAEGLSQGLSQGKLDTIIDFVKDGLCSVETGTEKARMTVEEFKAKMGSDPVDGGLTPWKVTP